MITIPQWVDCNYSESEEFWTGVGTTGYLVRTVNENCDGTRWSLRDRPLRTNRSNEPILNGWGGSTNNISKYAYGVAKVVAINLARDRCRIQMVTGKDLAEFVEKDGYPDLICS